jgi:hypothetical protein
MNTLTLASLLFVATSASAQVAPHAQVMGPGWQGQWVDRQGEVIAENGPCRQIAVDRADGLPGVDGRLWGCWARADRAPDLGQLAHIRGRVATTRLTRMGPYLRVVPQVNGL